MWSTSLSGVLVILGTLGSPINGLPVQDSLDQTQAEESQGKYHGSHGLKIWLIFQDRFYQIGRLARGFPNVLMPQPHNPQQGLEVRVCHCLGY
jgi:hypothetical protein